jgi:hypothetical protein
MRSVLKGMALAITGGISVVMLGIPTVAQACAVCIGASAEDQGYFWGVLFLMAMPFLLAGSIGGWIFFQHRRSPGASLPDGAGQGLD